MGLFRAVALIGYVIEERIWMLVLKRISEELYRISNGWVTLVALIVFVLFTALVLPRQATQAASADLDAGSPDTSKNSANDIAALP